MFKWFTRSLHKHDSSNQIEVEKIKKHGFDNNSQFRI